MQINSPVFNHGTNMSEQYTCLGENINPPLVIDDVPEGVVSFVLIFDDADSSPIWTHWLLFNIPSSTRIIHAGQIPEGATEGLANNHSFGYEGPCPKYFRGTHRYFFRLYALDGLLNLKADSERQDVENAMRNHIIGEASLLVLCSSVSVPDRADRSPA
jgi:Raf kinase inhibitor-like YbhB/YbcL family protein